MGEYTPIIKSTLRIKDKNNNTAYNAYTNKHENAEGHKLFDSDGSYKKYSRDECNYRIEYVKILVNIIENGKAQKICDREYY